MNASLETASSLPELRTQHEPRPNGVGQLILLEGSEPFRVLRPPQLADIFPKETLWILNDAAVLPASFWVEVEASGERIELRVASLNEESGVFSAIAFGAGDFHVQTELRGQISPLSRGSWLRVVAQVGPAEASRLQVLDQRGRLLELAFPGGYRALLDALYAAGAPIQYAYTRRPHRLGEVQNSYVGRPWAIEPASAGRPLSAAVLRSLQTAGHHLAWLTHAAGISSTGDPKLDALLPFPERYEIPAATREAIARARSQGAPIVAVGSSTARALESAASPDGVVRSGRGLARLKIHAGYRPRIVDVLLTGIHEAGSSHRELTRAFASDRALNAAWRLAATHDLKRHEFGDALLIRR